MLGLAVLEVAGFILCGCAAERLVRTLPETLRHRRDQRVLLLMADGGGVQAWRRQPRKKKFIYTVKVSEHITHIKRFKGTKMLIRDFGMIADILGDRMGCFLFQLPPSYR